MTEIIKTISQLSKFIVLMLSSLFFKKNPAYFPV